MSGTDVVIAGGGMAGSLLALVLGRQGREVTVVDPHRDPPPTFRNEKLGHAQIALLEKLGCLHLFAEACWPAEGAPGAYPAGRRPALYDCGAPHSAWLRSVRGAWPASVRFVEGGVDRVETGRGRPALVTTDGTRLDGRMLVVATGRSPQLLDQLGLSRTTLSAGHSVCLGFSVRTPEPLCARVHAARFGTGLGYVSIFPMPGETRVNVFSYRDLRDPWTRRMSADPLAAVAELVPEAACDLQGAEVVRRCEARGTDLYLTQGQEGLPGVVLMGDALHAPCPASGTGMLRILNDVDVLAERWIPRWLAADDDRAPSTAAFYADPRKRGVDRASLRGSRAGRELALSDAPYWRARRTAKRVLRSVRRAA